MRVACKQMSDYSYKWQADHDYPPEYLWSSLTQNEGCMNEYGNLHTIWTP
jgi:hypothetical protein